MIAVNQLIQDAYETLVMVGLGETAQGEYQEAAKKELNRLISVLNSQGFISMAQHYKDMPRSRTLYIKKLVEGETDSRVIDMEPPDTVVAVARRIGNSFAPLDNGNIVQMSMKNPRTIATSWTYDIIQEEIPGTPGQLRNVGVITLDGDPMYEVRVFYNSNLPKYELDDIIYLSDLYNELLLSGLTYRLACFYELADSKKADMYADFTAAKNLITRNNATSRMLQCGNIGGDWRTPYVNGLNGVGF